MGEPSSPAPAQSGSLVDFFAMLHQPRRPWLEPNALKTKFLELSSEIHPDRVHGASEAEKESATRRYAELNAAYHGLLEPKERLGHLLTLERGSKPAGLEAMPEEATELFFKIGQLCRAVDGFLAGRPKEGSLSPLLKVERFKEAWRWSEQVQAQLNDVQARWAEVENQLRALDEQWARSTSSGDPHLLAECEAVYRRLSYLSRWRNQLREKLTQLSME